jgi:putative endonuclease
MEFSEPRPSPVHDPGRASRGRLGETLAALFLESRGYSILARNLRLGRRELDLIVERGDLLVAVEVKWRRSGPAGGGAAEAWGRNQRTRAAEAALLAMEQSPAWRGRPWRFDLIAIEEEASGWHVVHHRGAWSPRGSWW